MNKKNIFILVIFTIAVTIFILLLLPKKVEKNFSIQEATGKIVTEDSTTFEYKSNNSTDMAKEVLESNVLIDDDNYIKEQVNSALEHIYNVENPYPSKNFGITSPQMLESIKMAQNFSYHYDIQSFQAFESNNKNVVQFIVNLSRKSDKETVTITGNYVTGTKQIQFTTIQGSFKAQSDSDTNQSVK